MSTNYHTAITAGAPANAATINAPLGQLDAAIGAEAATRAAAVAAINTYLDASNEVLKAWAQGMAYEPTAVTYDADGVVSSATVKWPDGSAGTFTRTVKNSTWLAVDAYTVSHADSGKTVTQAAVTRDGSGSVTVKPALTVA